MSNILLGVRIKNWDLHNKLIIMDLVDWFVRRTQALSGYYRDHWNSFTYQVLYYSLFFQKRSCYCYITTVLSRYLCYQMFCVSSNSTGSIIHHRNSQRVKDVCYWNVTLSPLLQFSFNYSTLTSYRLRNLRCTISSISFLVT